MKRIDYHYVDQFISDYLAMPEPSQDDKSFNALLLRASKNSMLTSIGIDCWQNSSYRLIISRLAKAGDKTAQQIRTEYLFGYLQDRCHRLYTSVYVGGGNQYGTLCREGSLSHKLGKALLVAPAKPTFKRFLRKGVLCGTPDGYVYIEGKTVYN